MRQQAKSMRSDEYFFDMRREAKTYISKAFDYGAERRRNVVMVMEGNDQVLFGEVEGAMCLRVTGEKRKTQVVAMVTQDGKKRRRLTLQTFKSAAGDTIKSSDKNEFTFRGDEFERVLTFLK